VPDDDYERSCAGKDKYPSESAALASQKIFHQGHLYHPTDHRDWEHMHPYPCKFCQQWHLGAISRYARKMRRSSRHTL